MKISSTIVRTRPSRRPAQRWLLALLVLTWGLLLAGASAAQEPIRAVFFDLGDTLVEPTGGGLFSLRAGAVETIDALQAQGIDLGVITNVPAGWTQTDLEALLVEPSFLDEFAVVILSSQAPASKPDPAIYSFAFGELGVSYPITEAAFVGETLGEIANLEVDPTEGCRSVGMIGIHLSDAAPSPLADFTVPTHDLPQIAQLVDLANAVFVDDFESSTTDDWSTTVSP